jgi:hypothetical protein
MRIGKLAVVGVVLSVLTGFGPALAPAEPKVMQLRVAREAPNDLQLHMPGNDGTQIAVLLDAPQGDILGIDEGTSVLVRAVDDKGTDLAGEAGAGRKWVSAFFAKVSKDARQIAVPLQLSGTPVPGATSIDIEGTLAIKCGTDLQKHEAKDVKLVTGSTFELGAVKMSIGETDQKARLLPEGVAFAIKVDESIDTVKELVFTDVTGQPLKSRPAGRHLPHLRRGLRQGRDGQSPTQTDGRCGAVTVATKHPAVASIKGDAHRIEIDSICVPFPIPRFSIQTLPIPRLGRARRPVLR